MPDSGEGHTALDILLGAATDVLTRERERFGICQSPRVGTLLFPSEKDVQRIASPSGGLYNLYSLCQRHVTSC